MLLAPDEPPAFDIHGRASRLPVLIVCDHASRRFPRSLAGLGVPEKATFRHIAWDIGAGPLARGLADRLGVQAVLAGYSRLVIDCNRRLDDPTSIVAASDGDRIPGNVGLSAAQRDARRRELFEPYHAAIERALGRLSASGATPAVVAVHSFTPTLGRSVRPWHVGVLWDRDGRIAVRLLERLRAEHGLIVGDNEPYSGRDLADYTVDTHAELRGWPHVCLEVRQDLLEQPEGIDRWADLLTRCLQPILADDSLYADDRRAGRSR